VVTGITAIIIQSVDRAVRPQGANGIDKAAQPHVAVRRAPSQLCGPEWGFGHEFEITSMVVGPQIFPACNVSQMTHVALAP